MADLSCASNRVPWGVILPGEPVCGGEGRCLPAVPLSENHALWHPHDRSGSAASSPVDVGLLMHFSGLRLVRRNDQGYFQGGRRSRERVSHVRTDQVVWRGLPGGYVCFPPGCGCVASAPAGLITINPVPDQGLNPGLHSESNKSSPLDSQGIPMLEFFLKKNLYMLVIRKN